MCQGNKKNNNNIKCVLLFLLLFVDPPHVDPRGPLGGSELFLLGGLLLRALLSGLEHVARAGQAPLLPQRPSRPQAAAPAPSGRVRVGGGVHGVQGVVLAHGRAPLAATSASPSSPSGVVVVVEVCSLLLLLWVVMPVVVVVWRTKRRRSRRSRSRSSFGRVAHGAVELVVGLHQPEAVLAALGADGPDDGAPRGLHPGGRALTRQ